MDIYTSYISTPLGELFAAANNKNLIYLHFYDEQKITRDFPYYLKNKNPNFKHSENKILKALKIQIKEYFDKKRKIFEIPTAYFGTRFQLLTWINLENVPFGTILNYSEFAEKINEKGKARAVAYAISRNPILIINPCHRIIGSNKKLTGYAGGLWRKKALINLEITNSQHLLF